MSTSIHPYKRHLFNSQNIQYNDTIVNPETEIEPEIPVASNPEEYNISNGVIGETSEISNDNKFSTPENFNVSNTDIYQDLGKPSAIKDLNSHGNHQRSVSSLNDSPGYQLESNNSSSVSISSDQYKKIRQQRTRSVDLSHMYLLNHSHDAQLTATNESVADISHQMISRYLGTENNTSLMPRLKTIEMYRENVKKSKDPTVLFEYAQYMLQTALTIDSTNSKLNTVKNPNGQKDISSEDLKTQFLKEAQHYLKKLSAKGYSDAQYLLGDAHSSGAFGKVENRESFTLFQAAAKHGHIESAYRTAHCYEEGLGTTRDSRKALNFLKFAASRNQPSAMYKLGLYSFYGRMGLPDDVNTKQNGVKWLSRASARANELTCAAPYELAKIYDNGFLDIIIPDEKYAMELYIQAATLGHAQSATLLGQIYETGNSTVEQDISLSVHYYTQAAVQGNDPLAMLGLCAWYLLGAEPAFKRDESEAFQWAYRAANFGLPKAQFTLGYFYENGKGCEANNDLAWKWYEKAGKNNDQRAINKINKRGKISAPNKKLNHKKNMSTSTSNLFSVGEKSNNQNNDNNHHVNGAYLEVQRMDTPKYFNNPTFKKIDYDNTDANRLPNNNTVVQNSSMHNLNTLRASVSVPKPNNNMASDENNFNSKFYKNEKSAKKDKKKKECIVM